MSDNVKKVLLVEDNENHAAMVQAMMTDSGTLLETVIDCVPSFEAAIARLDQFKYDICLLDYRLGDVDGLDLLRSMRSMNIDTPVIFLTSMGDEDVAVEAMKAGATDYIRKENLSPDLLAASTRFALEAHEKRILRRQVEEALRKAKAELENRVKERTSDLLQANRALKEADEIKNQMIQNVSHEFRTPLAYLIGYIELLLDANQGMGPLNDEQRRSLEIVASQAHKLTRLVNNFVSIQMLETSALERESVNVAEFLQEAVDSASLYAQEKGVGLALKVVGELPLVDVDRLAMGQVIDNLLANALKFTGEGGQVNVRGWWSEDDGKVYVSVADDGIGIAQEMQGLIFERFVQVDGTATREYGGVGLGLAVCKEIVQAHDELIMVESKPGKGSEFTFTMRPASS